MTKVFFSYTEEETRPLARELFIEAVRFDFSKDKHHRMFAEAERILSGGVGGIDIRGYYEVFGSEAYCRNSVELSGRVITAAVFSRFPDTSVKNVIPYIITGGECSCRDEDDIVQLLFAHMWGTAYIDAGRLLFERDMKQRTERDDVFLSPAFSPGFYGMSHEQSREIADILGAADIGVQVLDSGTMLPIKTVSGIYLAVGDGADCPTGECLNCIGNKDGCSQCIIRNKRVLKQ
jgi:hypothetical protein